MSLEILTRMSLETLTVPIHAGATAELPVNVRLFVGAIAGFGAAALATLGLERLDDGEEALSVLVASATGTTPESVTPRSTSLFLYTVGMILGLLYEGVVITYETVWAPTTAFWGVVGPAQITAATVVALGTYVAVTSLVGPLSRYSENDGSRTGGSRTDGSLTDGSRTDESGTREPYDTPRTRTWLALSLTFGLALVVLVPVTVLLVPGAH